MSHQEICSGGQRIHDPDLLAASMEKHQIDPEPLRAYVEVKMGSFCRVPGLAMPTSLASLSLTLDLKP